MAKRILISVLLLSLLPAAQAAVLQIPPAAQAGPGFNPRTATDAYLATYKPEQKARSDAYFEEAIG